MKLNVQSLVKARGAWHGFRDNHPNLMPFMQDILRKGLREDVQLEIKVHFPDGEEKNCGIRLKQGDMEMIKVITDLL